MNGIIDAVLSMKMDVYRQLDIQDIDTGAIKREWQYYKTVSCHAKGVVSNSATTRSSDRQTLDNRYINDQTIQVRTNEKITIREKVTNIRSADGTVVWEEINFPTNTPTVFEVTGSTPLTDPFGNILAFNSTMKRSENQQIGQ